MISVIIPLYNKEQSIASTIESVLAQEYKDFELIVVNDGSTDSSAQVVQHYINETKPCVRLIDKSNGGVCSARNKGIEMAQGEYIALLDADDQWDKSYLSEQVKMINDFPAAAMWGINYAEMSNGKLIRSLPTGLAEDYRGYVNDYFNIKGRVSDLFCSSSVVIRKSVFDKTGMFDERLKYSEDIDMWYRIIAIYPVVFYDRYMVWYLYDAENRTMNRKRLLRHWLPYYPDKYKEYKNNRVFYKWVQRWCAGRIKQIYFGDITQIDEARYASSILDYSVLPFKYRLFFKLPYCISKRIYLLDEKRRRKL